MSRLLLHHQQQQLEARSKAALQAAITNLLKLFGCMMLQYGLFQVSCPTLTGATRLVREDALI